MVEGAVDVFVQQRRFDFDRADLGGIGAARSGFGEGGLALARSASVQTSRPSAIEGLTVKPSGRVTTAFLMSELARPSGWSGLRRGRSRVKSRPVGGSAAMVVGLAQIVGLKPSLRSRPCRRGSAASALSWVSEIAGVTKVSGSSQVLGFIGLGEWTAHSLRGRVR